MVEIFVYMCMCMWKDISPGAPGRGGHMVYFPAPIACISIRAYIFSAWIHLAKHSHKSKVDSDLQPAVLGHIPILYTVHNPKIP